jgi:hypothetical protein
MTEQRAIEGGGQGLVSQRERHGHGGPGPGRGDGKDQAEDGTLADERYIGAQETVQIISSMLVNPDFTGRLDELIDRAERSMAVGPILHPCEFRAGADKLTEVLACATALRDARVRIAKAAIL